MSASSAAEPGTLERVSVGAAGERNKIETGSTTACAPTTVGKCTKRTVGMITTGANAGGYRVVFTSRAPNLVANDANGKSDVFVADVKDGAVRDVRLISTASNGGPSDGDSEGGAISANGVWVAFESRATNMAPSDNKLAADVFVKNLDTNQLYFASQSGGGQAGNQQSFSPSVANDGSVAFTSFATNLVASSQVPAFQAVYVRRDPAVSPQTQIVSVGDGNVAIDGPALEASISANGGFVAFTSGAKNIGGAETIADEDIFVRDLAAGTSKRITRGWKAFTPQINSDGTSVVYSVEGGPDGDARKDVYVSSVSGSENSGSAKSPCSGACDPATGDRPAVAPSIADNGDIAFQSAARYEPGVTSEQVWTNKGGTLAMASKNTTAAANDVSEFGSISPDGLFVSFTSRGTNLVGDNNGAPDVFLKNVTDGTVLRVSIRPPATEASGFAAIPTAAPAISGDGNIVAFESDSTNLVSPDENGQTDIFVRDRAAGTTVKITKGHDGAEADGSSRNPDISSDGRWIVFESGASNLVTGDANATQDVFLYDRNDGSTKRISISDAGFEGTGASGHPSISPNGEWIGFESLSSLAPPAAAVEAMQVYRYQRSSTIISRVSLGYPGAGGTRRVPQRDSTSPDAADNGAVVFLSEARNLTANDECGASTTPACDASNPHYQSPNRTDVFIGYTDQNIVRVNTATGGGLANGDSSEPVISADANRVAYSSAASNLAPDANTDSDIFLTQVGAGTSLMSIGDGGATPNGRSTSPGINSDGTLVTFVSTASNLVAEDPNGPRSDVFLASPGSVTKMISRRTDGTAANLDSFTPSISANGNSVAFQSLANNLVDGDNNNSFDAFVRDLTDADRPIPCASNCGGGGVIPGGPGNSGYRFVAADGGIFSFESKFYGSAGAGKLNKPIVAMAATPANDGYWLVASDGGIFSYGAAKFFGSTGDIKLNSPIVSMTATPSGNGYWFVAADGGIFSFGDAKFFGSMGGKPLNRPIVAMAASGSGNGYWLVASDGGIFSFGDAGFFGSTGNITLNKPIVGMDRSISGKGYRFVASDGGIFSFGDAKFLGSTGDITLNKPIVGMAKARTGDGYWLVASDGGIFSYGAAKFLGSTGDIKLNSPIVGMAG